EGRIVAIIRFDADDRRAASKERLERAAHSEAERWVPAAVKELSRALLDRDLVRCRAALPDDFVFHDHRRTGIGRVEGADAYIPWLASLLEESPDAINETIYPVARAPHASLSVMRVFGTRVDGCTFESFFVQLLRHHGDRFLALEVFEIEALDGALA